MEDAVGRVQCLKVTAWDQKDHCHVHPRDPLKLTAGQRHPCATAFENMSKIESVNKFVTKVLERF